MENFILITDNLDLLMADSDTDKIYFYYNFNIICSFLHSKLLNCTEETYILYTEDILALP